MGAGVRKVQGGLTRPVWSRLEAGPGVSWQQWDEPLTPSEPSQGPSSPHRQGPPHPVLGRFLKALPCAPKTSTRNRRHRRVQR